MRSENESRKDKQASSDNDVNAPAKDNTPEETAFFEGNASTVRSSSNQPSTKPGGADSWIGRSLGKYQVSELLGVGGMGAVYRAQDTTIERDVAVKILPAELTEDDTTRRRFLAEAKSAGKLSHPNSVVLYEIAEEDNVSYMVMELVTDGSVADHLQNVGTLSVNEATRVMIDACKGVEAAHEIGLIHRDIKPGNLLRTKEGTVKVADFGLAKLTGDRTHQITQAGQIVGTPYFMSPEQCENEIVDHRGDIYSLGATYYSLLTGESPFQDAGSAVKVMYAHCHAERPNPRDIRPEVPAVCTRIINRAMAKQPGDRYQSVKEMRADLEAIDDPALSANSGIVTKQISNDQKGSRRPIVLGVGLLVLLASIIVLASVINSFYSKNTPETEPQGVAAPVADPVAEPIKVGVLHSLTGTMAASEAAVVDATLLAVQELNDAGGVLGRQIVPVVRDGRSDPATFAAEAESLINEEGVTVVFGCWTSASRKTVVPVFETHDHLLVYPLHYEGAEQSPNVIYTGATPNQLIIPTLKWAYAFENKRRFFLVGSDYVYPRTTNEIVKDYLKELGAEVVGEEYAPLGSTRFQGIVSRIVAAKPDVILNTINGDSNTTFFRELHAAGITPKEVPTISTSIGEEEIRGLNTASMEGDLAPWSYFQSLDTPENAEFVRKVHERFGPQRVVTSPMESAYYGVNLWAQAVETANTDDVGKVREAMLGQRYQAPHGEVRIDADTQHTYKTPRIGRILEDGQFEIIWSGAKPVRPVSHPASRTKEEWKSFLDNLYNEYGKNWQAPVDD